MTCNTGSLKTAPNPPANVNASDGEYTHEVVINWTSSEGTEQYKIYRDGSWMGFVSSDQFEYIDIIPELDITYEYCIEAVNECGESDFKCDTGYTIYAGGDINTDGSIDVLDIIELVNIIIGVNIPSDEELVNADMNSDAIVDVLDIIILVNVILEN